MASNVPSLIISRESLKEPYVISEELHSVLTSVTKLEPIATLHQIFEALKIYIIRKKLFNPVDPSKIVCKNDQLCHVFGVPEFTLLDMKSILQKLIVPHINDVNTFSENLSPGVKGDGAIKRTLNVGPENDDEIVEKKRFCDQSNSQQSCLCNCSSPMILYIPSTPDRCDVSDLAESIQGYETEYVKDSSDITPFWSESENDLFSNDGGSIAADVFDIEYEVEYSSEHNTLPSGSDTDEEEVILNTAAIISALQKTDSDFEFWADESSEGEEDIDVEIPASDRWQCRTCGSLNKPPMRYCLACFDQRTGWLPEKKKKDFEKWKMSSFRRKRQMVKKKKHSKNPQEKFNELHSDNSSSSFETEESDSLPESQKFYCFSENNLESLDASQGTSARSLVNYISFSCPSLQTSGFESSQTINDSAGLSQESSPSMSQNEIHSSNPSLQSSGFLSNSAQSSDYLLKMSGDIAQDVSDVEANSSSIFGSANTINSCSDYNNSSQEQLNYLKNVNISSRQVIVPSESNEQINALYSEKLCIICCSSPALGLIIHGKIAHQVTCYKCARTLQKQKKMCPICRRTIQKVVRQICIM